MSANTNSNKNACRLFALALMFPAILAQAAPDLSVTKTVDNPQPGVGQPVEFTIELTNVGPDAALSAQVLDMLPTGTAIPDGAAAFPSVGAYDPVTGVWTVGGLDPAQAATLVVPAIITEVQPPACIVNKATALDPGDTNPDNDIALAALRQAGVERCVDLSVIFSVASLDQIGCDTQTYSVRVELANAGPDTARDLIVELSQDPMIVANLGFISGLCTSIVDGRCLIAELPAGDTMSLQASADALPLGQTVSQDLIVNVTSTDVDYDPSNDRDARPLGTGVLVGCGDIDLGDLGIGAIGPGCFIATAAYGSALDPHVDSLRRFRDRYLVTNAWGRSLVAFYYRHSPPLADYIAQRPWARAIARGMLAPLVFAVAYPMAALGLTLFLLLGLSCLWVIRRRRALE